MIKTLSALLGIAALAAAPAVVFAQQSGPRTTPLAAPQSAAPQSGPAGFPVGPLMAFPGVDLAHGHDDNLFLRPNNKTSSSFTVLSPYIKLEGKPTPHQFDLTFRIDDGRYHSSAADSYTDYSLLGNADLVFSGRAGLKLRAEHKHGHDPRGSTDRAVAATPDEYDNTGIDGIFRYGAPGARGRIEVDAGSFARRYTNNRLTTEASDRDTNQLGGTFFWRIMPRTELLFDARYRDIDYKSGVSTLDSDETAFYVGAKWEATAATTGLFKIGHLKKDFSSPLRRDFSGSSWDAGVRWSPRTYSVFDFTTSKAPSESTGVGDTVVGKNYGVTWSHAWNSRFRTQALLNYRTDTFEGAGVTREDDTSTMGVKALYQFRRWLKFGVEYTHSDRDSNAAGFDYKRNLLLFTVGATL